MKKNRFTLIYGVVLTCFTLYMVLDTFVLSSAYSSAEEANLEMFASEESTSEENSSDETDESDEYDEENDDSESEYTSTSDSVVASDTILGTYESDETTITVSEYTYEGTEVYVADVTLSSAQYLKTAFAEDTYGKNVTETTSEMAEANDAILAINGDNYGSQESGYVIRNGVIYREDAGENDVLCIFTDGSMKVYSPDEYTAEELLEMGVWQAFSFGPALVEDGEVSVTSEDEVGKAMASNPRTAIGIIDELHYLIVVSDGRTSESEGLSLKELAEFMESLGATTAYNLDGGGSSTMVFEGEVINNPTTSGKSIKEREVNDIVYIG
ncbi:MAG: phosphodiester glycosidase family protein [Lachnospiraceae bacterium]|nr:phosphodiester glycosidase family protein [Lachnospiraceae bacterium]